MEIKLYNIDKSITETKIIDLFNLANKNSNIFKGGEVAISKQSPDTFNIEHNDFTVGHIKINRKGNKIKNYTITLKDRSGSGYLNIPRTTYKLHTLSKNIQPEYEEWTCSEIYNEADLFICYKIFHDITPLPLHHCEVEVFNYGNRLKLRNFKKRVVNDKKIVDKEYYFDILFLTWFAFKNQDVFIDLFNTNDFKQALKHEKFQDNLNVLKMYHI